jgi:hypothetical protein
LEVVKDMSGSVACTPGEVHGMVTRHFREWYANPSNNNSTLHTAEDWRAPLASLGHEDWCLHTHGHETAEVSDGLLWQEG